ncbi:hypothetical protein [Megamonas hypermegale]|uniref:hypothetical protein n=1 Tax=Megamonas hypermegale TaxID=158847 RepID=UPI0026E9CB1B|nr:hypothetical protein [Megamonas hypermegale]
MSNINECNQIINKMSLLEDNQRQILSRLKKINKVDVKLDVIEELLRLLIANQFLTDMFQEDNPFKLLTNREIRDFAEKKQIKLPARAKKSELIHIIQRAEGNLPCYATKLCSNFNCLWYSNCQKAYKIEL